MAKYSDRELYVLKSLQVSFPTGCPLDSWVIASPIPAAELVVILQKLEKDNLVKLRGPSGLNDLEKLVCEAGPLEPPIVEADGKSWTINNAKAFDNESYDMFYTLICLTLRGRASLFFNKKEKPSPLSIAAKIASPKP